jgi:hypothetical protein
MTQSVTSIYIFLKLDTSNKITNYHIIIILPTDYVLVLCDYSFPTHEIVSQLSKLPCVKEVERVNGPYGPYDIVMKLFDDNMSS